MTPTAQQLEEKKRFKIVYIPFLCYMTIEGMVYKPIIKEIIYEIEKNEILEARIHRKFETEESWNQFVESDPVLIKEFNHFQ